MTATGPAPSGGGGGRRAVEGEAAGRRLVGHPGPVHHQEVSVQPEPCPRRSGRVARYGRGEQLPCPAPVDGLRQWFLPDDRPEVLHPRSVASARARTARDGGRRPARGLIPVGREQG
ncbi:hypothetical protein I3F58_26480 [Streptomyces sp. MUM 203J]|uniref:hypothetical protein n=1 Tax=Streptomyces sp. MUM 203J TaxID=2791990 RepID=UPI001F047099|nr:hypothetical protein [Streptomyces sp. MUM 203J]MCH0543037.1 hypothetical protein [Streptomyces sp. MUM 203J]